MINKDHPDKEDTNSCDYLHWGTHNVKVVLPSHSKNILQFQTSRVDRSIWSLWRLGNEQYLMLLSQGFVGLPPFSTKTLEKWKSSIDLPEGSRNNNLPKQHFYLPFIQQEISNWTIQSKSLMNDLSAFQLYPLLIDNWDEKYTLRHLGHVYWCCRLRNIHSQQNLTHQICNFSRWHNTGVSY